MSTVFLLVLLIMVHVSFIQGANLLLNSDFEDPHDINPWQCRDCQASVVNDSYHGKRSLQVTNRHHTWAGLTQAINVTGGQSLKCQAYIKLLNLPHGKFYVGIEMRSVVMGQSNRGAVEVVGREKYHQKLFGWDETGGDILLPADAQTVKLFLHIDDPSVNYLVDYFTCDYITNDSDWKSKANQRIEILRKSTLNITLEGSAGLDTSGITVQINQTKSKFAFGTAVNANKITDSTHKPYQDFVYNNFEWAVLENALKWKLMEWTQGHANYDKAMDAINALLVHGMQVRGHNMFWGTAGHSPKWLDSMSPSEMRQQIHQRINDMIAHTRGKLQHWDVNNENLHGDYFEQKAYNANITMEMFNWMYYLEPNVKLFLNDFSVVSSHLSTTAYKNQGKRFKDSKVPIYGMGVQSHFRSSQLDINVLKYRLDKIAESGLPIWITELSIIDPNENSKAAALDDVVTLYFSHWAVEGILLWGFWDGVLFNHNASLATGENVIPNAAGRKWQELFHQRFRTQEIHSFNGSSMIQTRIFFGEHEVTIKQNGKTIHTETINLDHDGQTATFHLQGSGSNLHVSHVAFG